MKKMTKKALKSIEIDVDKDGFTLWITEDDGTRHWLIDGSSMKYTGRISIGNYDGYKHKAIIDENNDQILLTQK